HVVQAEQIAARNLIGQFLQGTDVDARNRHVTADPVRRQNAEREQQPVAKFRDGEDVPETVHRNVLEVGRPPSAERARPSRACGNGRPGTPYVRPSVAPPAAAIFFTAVSLTL